MTLDVPYGDHFKAVTVDRFTKHDSTGHVWMERTFALEWVKSTWMKSVIEKNAPGNVKNDADVLAEVMKKAGSGGAVEAEVEDGGSLKSGGSGSPTKTVSAGTVNSSAVAEICNEC